jgi:hypothetical protein
VTPILREKPLIQPPVWSRMTPPAPAGPGFPSAEPSVLSLKKLVGGGLQFTEMSFCVSARNFLGEIKPQFSGMALVRCKIQVYIKSNFFHDPFVTGCPDCPN